MNQVGMMKILLTIMHTHAETYVTGSEVWEGIVIKYQKVYPNECVVQLYITNHENSFLAYFCCGVYPRRPFGERAQRGR